MADNRVRTNGTIGSNSVLGTNLEGEWSHQDRAKVRAASRGVRIDLSEASKGSLVHRRYRPILLLAAAIAADVALTLHGQPNDYWLGDRSVIVEANPLARSILQFGPWAFAGFAVAWLLPNAIVLAVWRHRAAEWLVLFVALCHTVAAASWLFRSDPWGPALALVFLAAAVVLFRRSLTYCRFLHSK